MSTIIIGLSLSFLLFLLSAGLTLIFGMLGVINFAHGALYMLGAYASFQIVQVTGSYWLGLLFAPMLVAGFGALIEILALKRVYSRDHIFQLLLTFGLILVIDDATKMIWGLDYKQVPTPEILAAPVTLFGSQIPAYRLFVIAFGAVVSLGLFLLLDDMVQYWWHRASHTFPWLYNLHRAHHNARYMSVRLVYRNNVLYYAMMPNLWMSGVLIYRTHPVRPALSGE